MGPDTKHFRYNSTIVWELRVGILCGLSVAAVAVYSALFDPPVDEGQWPWLLGVLVAMLGGSIVMMRFHHLVSSAYAIDSATVSQLRQQVIVRQLDWGQIQELRFRRLTGQLELRTTDRDASIRVEKQLKGFDLFVHLVEERTGLELRTAWW